MSAAKILIVEGELVIGLDLEHRIKDMGYDVIAVVPSGREAIERASNVTPDLVLMDIKLSGELDGIETSRRMREHVEVPIVFVTAFADQATVSRVTPFAPYGYMVTPIQKDVLRAVIESALSRSENEKSLRENDRALALAHEAEKQLRVRLEAVDRAGVAVANALANESSGFHLNEFLQVIVDEARTIANADYAALGIVAEAGQPFSPWVFSGLSREQAAAIGRHPRPVGLLGEVVNTGRAISLRDLHEHQAYRGFPAHHPEMKGFLGVPIRYRGESRGNLYLTNKRGAQEFTEEDQETIAMLAERVAFALEIGRLREVEARERARLEFLAKVGPALSRSLDFEATLKAIGTLIVPSVAELCTLDLVEEDGTYWKAIAQHVDPAKQKLLEGLLGPQPAGTIPEPRREVLIREITDELLERTIPDQAHREILRKVAAKSSVTVPLVLRGRTIGVLQVGNGGSRARLGEEDVPLVQEIAHLATFALENARLHQATEHHEKQQRFLAEAGSILAVSLEHEETLASVARLAVRELADWCVVDLLDNPGRTHGRSRKVVHRNSAKAVACKALRELPLDRHRPHFASSVLKTKPVLVSEVEEGYVESIAQSEEHLELLRELGVRSFMALPLLAREHLLGVLILVSSDGARMYGAEDLKVAEQLAHLAALALENARLYQVAQRAIQARDDVTAIVSHDLRNPLGAIRLSLEILARAPPEVERRKGRKQLDVIDRSATRMEQLIGGLRDATMIETGQFTVEPKQEEVSALLSEAVSLLEPQADAQRLRLKLDLVGDLPSIHCDRGRVLQVVGNLVGNAIKFTEMGGEIRITVRPLEDGICVSVSDTGAGISEREVPYVFDRYWKGKKKGKQGTGLGLYIVKGIVEAHGGRIWAESKLNEGSTFHFVLPVSPPADSNGCASVNHPS